MLQQVRLEGLIGPCHPFPDPNIVQAQMWELENSDFSLMRFKLMLPAPEGLGWTEVQALEAEKWYRRFLILAIKYPNHTGVPNKPIDEFWHAHILDTRKYEADCKRIFGHTIHHYPYYGLNGDAKERDADFDLTNELYRAEFGEDCTGMGGSEQCKTTCGMHCHGSRAVSCGGRGSGTGCGQRCGRN